MRMLVLYFALLCLKLVHANVDCPPSITTASGTSAPTKICAGDLIFSDAFDSLDVAKWKHEKTLAGGGNWEFQWYTNNRTNSFVQNGILYIKPTLTSEQFGEDFLSSGTLDLNGGTPADQCTNPKYWGCSRTGNSVNIVNPIKSANLRTTESFSFRYGIIEVLAKIPSGDWLWPAIWLSPRFNAYGEWPASGEIDILESRGNKHLKLNDINIGSQEIGSTLHWGPDASQNHYNDTHWKKTSKHSFSNKFHKYALIWTPDYIKFFVDDIEIGSFTPPSGGFWEYGNFTDGYSNPWIGGTRMAPFDQEFFITINLAVGGIAYFPDEAENPKAKPWKNNSPKAATDFWAGREDWLPTWKLNENNDAAFQIDCINVYAL